MSITVTAHPAAGRTCTRVGGKSTVPKLLCHCQKRENIDHNSAQSYSLCYCFVFTWERSLFFWF